MLGLVIGLVIVYLFIFQRTNVSAAEESEDNEDDERTTNKKSIQKFEHLHCHAFGDGRGAKEGANSMVCHKRRTVKDASSGSPEIKSTSHEKSDNEQLPVYQKIHSSSCCIWYDILSAPTLTSFDIGWR
jgi:hypothetical protein